MMKKRYCDVCGSEIRNGNMCKNCLDYFKEGGKLYPLPPKGKVLKAKNDQIICHICGKAVNDLEKHVLEDHQMTLDGYGLFSGVEPDSDLKGVVNQ
jgi:hypothetical protein